MSGVALERVVIALRDAGLLVSADDRLPATVATVTDDSRVVGPGTLFLAVRGTDRDGHDYLAAAEAAGATAAVVDDASRTALPALVVTDSRRAAAVAAAAFHDFPARSLRLVGVTGTNGKTTTVGMLRHLLDEPGRRAASIGTLGILVGSEGRELPGGSGLTTPGPVELQRVLRALVDAGVSTVAMETSSHALHQRRVEGLRFAAGVFTNLTRDHLDYHVTMEAYLAAKALLVDALADDGVSVVNADDDAWGALRPAPRTVRFGLHGEADVRAEEVRFSPRGSSWTLACGAERLPVTLPLIGDFNIANALAAAAAAWSLGMLPRDVAARLATMPQVPGRLEIISDAPTVLRDYAHTGDALERALAAVRPFVAGRLIVVFGCGGDRDRGKRPEMGRIAQHGADVAIVTSDNPRTEDPERILDDVEAGMDGPHERIEDRRAAISHALGLAGAGDVILLAGKGHETYQIRGTEKLPFDERAIVRELLAERDLMADAATPQASALTQPRFWTLDHLADALGTGPRGDTALTRISTDTRNIAPGVCFVALRGETFDGHDYLREAVAKGAVALVVSDGGRAEGLGVPVYVVPDTLAALGALGRHRRRTWGGKVVGVVGTNGKTSTKELLRAAIGATKRVHATVGNYNNLVGVPLTLFAMPLDTEVAVIEMGTNHPGEVAALRAIVEPDIVVVTSIAEEHLEGLGDLAGVLKEEVSACEGVALAVTPASQPEVADASRKLAIRTVSAGLEAGERRAERWGIEPDGQGWLELDGQMVRVPLRGVHNLRNAMLALAVAGECGVSVEDAARGIAAMPAPPMRVNFEQFGGCTVINDAYNSNPGSARVALELLEHAGSGRQRVAVLGTMLELGDHAPRLHEEVARDALGLGLELVVGVGAFEDALRRVAPDDPRVVGGADPDAAWNAVRSRLAPDAVILLKGSRGVRLERLIPLISEWAATN